MLAFGLDVTLVPLDVTRRVRATRADLDRMAQGGVAARTCAALIAVYFDATRNISQIAESHPLHDPCVILLAAHPDLFGIDALALSVDCGAAPDAGALTPGPGTRSAWRCGWTARRRWPH